MSTTSGTPCGARTIPGSPYIRGTTHSNPLLPVFSLCEGNVNDPVGAYLKASCTTLGIMNEGDRSSEGFIGHIPRFLHAMVAPFSCVALLPVLGTEIETNSQHQTLQSYCREFPQPKRSSFSRHEELG
jgi:hypothetical protein